MAILEDLGLAVSVVIDGTAAQEYDDPEPALEHKGKKIDPTVTTVCNKYIVAKDKTEYLLRLEVLPQNNEVLPQNTWIRLNKKNMIHFEIYIDGKWRSTTGLRKVHLRDGYRKADVDGALTSNSNGCSKRRFSFGTITATDVADAQSVKADKERATDMGTIRIVVRRHRFRKLTTGLWMEHNDADLTIAENALKGQAVSHGTALSRAEACALVPRTISKKLDDHPIAIFNLKYRSKDALKQEMIVPRTPSPTPAQIVAGLDRAELERMAIERIVETRIKSESQWQGVKSESRIKAEPGTQPRAVKREFADAFDLARDNNIASPQPLRKMARLNNGKLAIDLTDD